MRRNLFVLGIVIVFVVGTTNCYTDEEDLARDFDRCMSSCHKFRGDEMNTCIGNCYKESRANDPTWRRKMERRARLAREAQAR